MKLLIKLEELSQFVLAVYLYSKLSYPWYLFIILLFLPDLGMIGYSINSKVGTYTYNLTHHKGLAILVYLLGIVTKVNSIALIGLIIFAHSSLDRVLDYGLKYQDSFQNTHLGKIGKAKS